MEANREQEIIETCRERLKHAVQALALPAQTQLSLFPDFVCKVDELALDFDNWWTCLKSRGSDVLNLEQRAALQSIEDQLSAMSGLQNHELWTEAALHDHPLWQTMRQLAMRALLACHWRSDVPPSHADEYIRGS